MLESIFSNLLVRVAHFMKLKWSGQLRIEINLTQGGINSVYLEAVDKKNKEHITPS